MPNLDAMTQVRGWPFWLLPSIMEAFYFLTQQYIHL